MINNLGSLLLEMALLNVSSLMRLEPGECGIMIHTSAWVCYLGYPFRKRHLHIALNIEDEV